MNDTAILYAIAAALCLLQVTALRSVHPARASSLGRAFAVLALVVPLPALLLTMLAMFPVLAEACMLFFTSWDRFLTFLFLLLAASGLVYASISPFVQMLGLWRLRRNSVGAGPYVSELVDQLVGRLTIARPGIVMTNDDRPYAKASSELRPMLYISSGLLRRLDRDELEGVLAHELAHLMLQHHRTSVLTSLLRDATWFLPTSGILRKRVHAGREAAADRLAAGVTGKPATLASAILAVCESASGGQSGAMALAILGDADDVQGRIGALLAMPATQATPNMRRPALARVIGLLPGGVMLFQSIALLLVLPLLGCGFDRA